MAAPAAVLADRDPLDVAGAPGPAAVPQLPLDHRRVADELGVVPQQGVHPAQGVGPVMVGQVVKHRVKQPPGRAARGVIEVSGVRDPQLSRGRP